MNLLQLHLHPDRLIRFAAAQGIARANDEDLGYACHAWLKAMFGDLAPKPFRLFDAVPGRPARLLAYGELKGEAMLEHARTFADPLAFSAWEEADFASRPMPSAWQAGRRLGFEVLACPMSRKDDTEKDVFLRRLDTDPEVKIERVQVYLEWLALKFAPAATLSTGRSKVFVGSRCCAAAALKKAAGGW